MGQMGPPCEHARINPETGQCVVCRWPIPPTVRRLEAARVLEDWLKRYDENPSIGRLPLVDAMVTVLLRA